MIFLDRILNFVARWALARHVRGFSGVEYAYLIELPAFGDQPPSYWTGGPTCGLGVPEFLPDDAYGVRFAREADALRVADGILWDMPTRVVEHGWR